MITKLLLFLIIVTVIFINALDNSASELDEDWWEVQKTEDKLFAPYSHSTILLRHSDLDESGIHSCYSYRIITTENLLLTNHGTFCYPSVVITGYNKSSSSALYNLLAQYPGAKVAAMKENCAYVHDRNLVQYFDSLPAYIEPGQLAIDGCIDLRGNMKLRKILKNPRTFYLVVFRDFADWLWSAYNFWCDGKYDRRCCDVDSVTKKCPEVGYWVDPVVHHRSPSTFHDIINGDLNGTYVPSPMSEYLQSPCEHGKHFTQRFVEELWSEVPVENTLFLASEVLDKSPIVLWRKVARRIGLQAAHPKIEDFSTVRYNSQVSRNSRGVSKKVSKTDFVVGVYLVSGFQPQLNSTRNLLNKCWAQDCALASTITGYRYGACDGSTIASVDVRVRSQLQRYLDFDSDMRQPSFFETVNSHCQASFIAARNRTKLVSESVLPLVLPKLVHVLMISNFEEDRMFLLKLLLYSTGVSNVIDTDDSKGELCRIGTDFISENQPMIVGTSAFNIQKTERGWTIIQSKSSCETHDAAIKDVVFTRIIVVARDPVISAWMQYQSSIGVTKVVEETLLVIDWEQWEKFAVRQLTHFSTNPDHIRLNEVWTSVELPSDRTIVRLEDVRYSSSRSKSLQAILHFIMREAKTNVTKDDLRCAYLLLTSGQGNRSFFAVSNALQTAWYSSHSTLAIAYASSPLICQVVQLFSGNLLLTSSLSLPSTPEFKLDSIPINNRTTTTTTIITITTTTTATATTTTTTTTTSTTNAAVCNSSSESKIAFQQKCKVRYKIRIFAPTLRVPVALVAMPGLEAVHVRLLIEHSVGIYSGSIATDHTLLSVLPGEAFCGQRMSTIHVSPLAGIFKTLRSGEGSISMSRSSISKCMRGSIRGLAKGLLLVKDPVYYVWEKYWRSRRVSNLLSVGKFLSKFSPEEESQMVRSLLVISGNYSQSLLAPKEAFRSLKSFLRSQNSMVVTYEALIHGESQRYNVLRSVLEFTQYHNVLPERLRCAYTFLELMNVERKIALMHRFFAARKSLLCQVYNNVYRIIGPTSFNFTRLYSEENC